MTDSVAPTHGPRYKWAVMTIVIIGTFMAILDSSIVNVALPHIMTAFGSSLDEAKWIVSGYMLAYAVLIPLAGYARDVVGGKITYMTALAVFTLASALCSFAWSNESLVFFRVLQAIGGGAIMPTGLMLITEAFEPHERGSAIGLWGVGITIAPALGPTLGGILVDTLGWRSIFYLNIPIGIFGVLLAQRLLISSPFQKRSFDFAGYIALSVFIIGALWGISEGHSLGWNSLPVMASLGLSALAFALFLAIETRIGHPIIWLRIFRIRNFTIAALISVLRALALFGTVFLLPVFMQNVMGYTATQTGMGLMPGAVAIGLFMPIAGRISDRYGPRGSSVFGVAVTAISLYMFSLLEADTPYMFMFWALVIRGVGLAFIMGPVTSAAMNAVAPTLIGMSSGVLNLFQQVGGAAGIALLELYVQVRAVAVGRTLSTGLDAERLLTQLEAMGIVSGEGRIPPNVEVTDLARQAAATAFGDVFLLSAIVMALGLIPALLMDNRRTTKAETIAVIE